MIDRVVLNPNLAFAWYASGLVKSLLGDEPAVAIEHISQAIRLNPLDPFVYTIEAAMALAHFFNGTYDESSSWALKALRNNPRNPGALRISAASNALAGRPEEARTALARALELDPGMRISNLDARVRGFRPAAAAKYADALRRAGLSE